ncbi:MAG TPA: sulfatase-like hydrolase/transferase, partial [Phycisphaerae bacterium]|nr:sulfatase-like hydrolase/transferase [Phycisphaerae bacterium]
MATHKLTRRDFLKGVGVGAAAVTVPGLARLLGAAGSSGTKPNFIIFFCDDLGYQDLGCYGSGSYAGDPRQLPAVSTPNLDMMAAQGIKFVDFYVSGAVCSASRSALLTGCYQERVGSLGALQPDTPLDQYYGHYGLNSSADTTTPPAEEITLAKLLKPLGYATACVGKW